MICVNKKGDYYYSRLFYSFKLLMNYAIVTFESKYTF